MCLVCILCVFFAGGCCIRLPTAQPGAQRSRSADVRHQTPSARTRVQEPGLAAPPVRSVAVPVVDHPCSSMFYAFSGNWLPFCHRNGRHIVLAAAILCQQLPSMSRRTLALCLQQCIDLVLAAALESTSVCAMASFCVDK